VEGFKRGSKQLGVPTANIEMTEENVTKAKALVPGVYTAKGTLNGKQYACALSVGWNPTYDNPTKTVEVYILHQFEEDFYGDHLTVVLSHFIRAEALFSGFDELILAI
jgi:FAD synthase